MSAPDAREDARDAGPQRRTTGRIIGGIVLILCALALLAGGIQAIVDPAEVIADSSNSARSPDTEEEAKIGGLLLCFFGITVLGFGIALFQQKKPSGGAPFGNKAE